MPTSLNLQIELATQLPSDAANAHGVYEKEPLPAAVASFINKNEFSGAADETLWLNAAAQRLLLYGLGPRSEAGAHTLRRAASVAVRVARERGVTHLGFALTDEMDARAVVEGVVLGLYENSFYRAQDATAPPPLAQVTLVVSQVTDDLRAAVRHGRIVAESANWARALADQPGGSLPPEEFARRAAEMAAEFGLQVETLHADEIQRRGMGGLWGIGKGSDHPPVLIVVRYEPQEAESEELWAFIGKGVTFDTGGISIKPPLKMEAMKGDMAGGAAALGALRALAQLQPKKRLVAIVPSAENMPSEKAIKPGDIVKTLAGYTLEVVDTDAEGRVVLVDGIAYAKDLGATHIVDLATLTGSIIVALGTHRAGLFSNNDAWAAQVIAAAEYAGEPVWRMPVSDDYKKRIESNIADFKNYGGRPDATAAALLLSKFAGDTPWVHLDIAGTAWLDEAEPHAPAGATGAGVRALVALALGA